MTSSEILLLARTYAESAGIALSSVSVRATGGRNDKLFDRLAAGHGANILSIERAAHWFCQHWPDDVPWPESVPRRKCAA